MWFKSALQFKIQTCNGSDNMTETKFRPRIFKNVLGYIGFLKLIIIILDLDAICTTQNKSGFT